MIILKVGGGKQINWDYIAKDLKSLRGKVVIIHGANAWMAEICLRLGIEEKFILSPSGHISRFTDKETLDVLTMVYGGLVNKRVVATLQKHGINAVGLTGIDGRLFLGVRKKAILSQEKEKVKIIRDSFTGNMVSINTELLTLLLNKRYTPVVTIPAITKSGELINVDNDRVVAALARDLKVKTIVMLFEASGLLRDPKDESSKIDRIQRKDLDKYIKSTQGRMRKKLLGVKEAFSFGVEKVFFGDGRILNPISVTLAGKGTVIN